MDDALMVSDEDRKTLETWTRMRTAAQRLVLRSRIALMLADAPGARGRVREFLGRLRLSR